MRSWLVHFFWAFSILIIAFLIGIQSAWAQTADPALLAEINQIKAIDNHSHPPKLVGVGEKDDDYDALPCDPLEPTAPNLMGRPDNPGILRAWKSLWGYRYDDMAPAHVQELLHTKERIKLTQTGCLITWASRANWRTVKLLAEDSLPLIFVGSPLMTHCCCLSITLTLPAKLLIGSFFTAAKNFCSSAT